MKAKGKERRKAARPAGKSAVAARKPPARWPYAVAFLLALAAAFEVYGPTLYGPFLFDDEYLPFSLQNFPVDSLRAWMAGVRPVLMASYWLNYQMTGFQTISYHSLNVIFHTANAVLMFYIVRKILELAQTAGPRRDVLAALAGGLFLLHPVNSEAVGYVASRSENLSVLFFFSAFALFLYRRTGPVTWMRAGGVLALFAAAAMTKEHTIALPALLLLTDYFWNPPFSFDGIKKNWRLYGPVVAVGAVVGAYLVRLLRGAPSAGFSVKGLTWYQYFFTECRAFWVYIRLFLFPAGLRVDYDFPVSHSLWEPGVLLGLTAILAAAGAAFWYRRRFPLAAYGFFAFLILMAPTSSFVPIKDPVAERRLYLSMIGLLLILLEWLRRAEVMQPKWLTGFAAVLVLAGVVNHQHNYVWGDPVVLWEDTVAKSPNKARDEFQLAQAYYEKGDCAKALPHYQRSSQLDPTDATLFVDWGLAYDCLNQEDAAIASFRHAAQLSRTAHVYTQIGMVYGKQDKYTEALDALATAEKIDPKLYLTYDYRGRVYLKMGNAQAAAQEFRHALALNPHNQPSSEGLAMAEARLQQR